MGRKGLPKGTTVHKQKAEENIKTLLDIEKGVYALPHPYKATESVAANRRWVLFLMDPSYLNINA